MSRPVRRLWYAIGIVMLVEITRMDFPESFFSLTALFAILAFVFVIVGSYGWDDS